MAWTAPKIQAMLLKVAPAKAAANLRVTASTQGARSPSPRSFGAESRTGYGGK